MTFLDTDGCPGKLPPGPTRLCLDRGGRLCDGARAQPETRTVLPRAALEQPSRKSQQNKYPNMLGRTRNFEYGDSIPTKANFSAFIQALEQVKLAFRSGSASMSGLATNPPPYQLVLGGTCHEPLPC